jgi:uncharacterized membrane protein
MLTIDRIAIAADADRVFATAREVERWPGILAHYRWVRTLEPRPSGALVEMAAWRPFGPLKWPTWWVSEMTVDAGAREIRYRHVRGITTGMDVVWRLGRGGDARGVAIELEHRWSGPAWPLIGSVAAGAVIGPVFVHGIASRTLAGLKAHLEAGRD